MKPSTSKSKTKHEKPPRSTKARAKAAASSTSPAPPPPTSSLAALRALMEEIPSGRTSLVEKKRRSSAAGDPKGSYINLGLAISGASLSRGQCRSFAEIAAYCGCSSQFIHTVEQRALAKMRRKILPMIKSGEFEWP